MANNRFRAQAHPPDRTTHRAQPHAQVAHAHLRQEGRERDRQRRHGSAAAEALRAAQPELQRAATKGVVHRNTITRKLSRLSARIKSLPTA